MDISKSKIDNIKTDYSKF